MTARLILIRHGRTDWNDEGRYQGQMNPGLNTTGRQQAHNTARQVAPLKPAAIYSSDLARALETAQIIGEALAMDVTTDRRLRELMQGKWEGMLYADIQQQYAAELQQFQADPLRHGPPEGENLAQLLRRVIAALDDIARQHKHQSVLVVTHKLPIAGLRCMLEGRHPAEVWDAIPENAQFVPFDWTAGELTPPEAWAPVHEA